MTKIHFRPYIPNQTVLFPQRIDEDIAENDPVRMVDALVEGLNLESFRKLYKECGRSPYHPRMMLKVILYAYMNNIYSCRKIEKLLHRDIHYIWLAGYEKPDFITINRFRNRVKKEITFHMSIVRFLPMMMMGIVLSYVRMKTDNMFYSSLFHFVHNASTIVASIAASFLYMFSQGNAAAGSGYATETYIGMYLIEAALMPIGLYMGSRLLMYQQTKSEGFFPKERRKKTIAKIVIPTILLILGGLFFLGIGMM